MPLATRAVVTEIACSYDGDAFSPELDLEWVATQRELHTALNSLLFAFVTYTRAA